MNYSRITTTSIVLALLKLIDNGTQVHCFIAAPSRPSSKIRSHTFLHMSNTNLSGKLVAQRHIYRLSPTRSSVTAPYSIEERQYFSISEDQTLEPYGDKRFYIRDDYEDDNDNERPFSPPEARKKSGEPRMYTRIGQSLYKMEYSGVDDEEEDDELGLTVWNSSFAMTLYCMANPSLVQGNVLELGSGVGIGAILSCIGVGLATATASDTTDSRDEEGFQSIEDIGIESSSKVEGTKSNYAPAPPLMRKIVLTDSSLPVLEKCVENIKQTSFPPSKVDIQQLDWNNRIPKAMVGKFDCILGCDCAYYFPMVAPLARTLAYSLRSSPYTYSSSIDDDQQAGGRFIHIGPEHRDSIDDLRTKLSKGYRMMISTENLVLEQFDLMPLILDSIDQEDEQLKKEVEGGEAYLEYQTIGTHRFTSMIGNHHEDYDVNGEYFFPVETGDEGSYRPDRQQLRDSAEGQWLG